MDKSRNPQPCSFEDFQAERAEESRAADELTKQLYRDRLKLILTQLSGKSSTTAGNRTNPRARWSAATNDVLKLLRGVGAFANKVDRVVDDLLTGKLTIGEDNNCDEIFTIKNVIKEYQELTEEAFLLLNAPADVKLPYAVEKEAREYQLQEFYNVCVGDQHKSKYPAMPAIVDKYEDILVIMRCFFKCIAVNAKRATIVFNGHGNPSGHLHLQNDPNAPHNTVFLEDVHKTWSQLKKSLTCGNGEKMILPVGVTVVLAHCYSFIHMQPMDQRPDIEVVSLASALYPETDYEFSPGRGRQLVRSSRHVQLWKYARHRSLDNTSSEEDEEEGGGRGGENSPNTDLIIPSFLVAMSLQATDEPCSNSVKLANSVDRFHETFTVVRKGWKTQTRRCSCSLLHIENKIAAGMSCVGKSVLGPGVPACVLGGAMVHASRGKGEHSTGLLADAALRLLIHMPAR